MATRAAASRSMTSLCGRPSAQVAGSRAERLPSRDGLRARAGALAACQLRDVGFDHEAREVLHEGLRPPTEFLLRKAVVAARDRDLGGTLQRLVFDDVLAPVK